MKQDVYELKNSLESYKRMLRLAENNYDELKEELERMKRIYEPKSKCKNCEGGCPASEITGRSCNP